VASMEEQSNESKHCADCGKAFQIGGPIQEPSRSSTDLFAVAQYASQVLARPAYVCGDCGAVICQGCVPVNTTVTCPKCGSDAMQRPVV
jgi:DNA-directed RNA polymerase subunit RPC12/RpoP